MPRTISTTVYTFDELATEKAKQAALNWLRETCYHDEWWDAVYEDAAQAGLKITSFDLDSYGNVNAVKGDFITTSNDTASLIIENHGEGCGTTETAQAFFSCQIKPDEFLANLLTDYADQLKGTYEDYYSDEHLIALMDCNEYTFTECGKRFG